MSEPEIDRNASKLVADVLRAKIEDGTYAPGSKLPSYRQLRDDHGVALNTAQVAVRLLATEGLVEIQPARGAFVREPHEEGSPAMRAELASVQSALRRSRQEMAAADRKLTSLLDRLPADESQ